MLWNIGVALIAVETETVRRIGWNGTSKENFGLVILESCEAAALGSNIACGCGITHQVGELIGNSTAEPALQFQLQARVIGITKL